MSLSQLYPNRDTITRKVLRGEDHRLWLGQREGPDHLERFGGAWRVTDLLEELTIIQRGRDPTHFEIVPAYPMALAEYEMALSKIVLVPV